MADTTLEERRVHRYLVFAGPDYYPAGGWGDFIGNFESKEDALKAAKLDGSNLRDWSQVIDTETMSEIFE